MAADGSSPLPNFHDRVFNIVARIPRGRVTTYGRIARAIGDPRGARMVGWMIVSIRSHRRETVLGNSKGRVVNIG